MIPTRVIPTTNREAVVAAEVVAEDEAIADEDEAETAAEDEAETAVEAVTTKKEETTSANSKIKAESNKRAVLSHHTRIQKPLKNLENPLPHSNPVQKTLKSDTLQTLESSKKLPNPQALAGPYFRKFDTHKSLKNDLGQSKRTFESLGSRKESSRLRLQRSFGPRKGLQLPRPTREQTTSTILRLRKGPADDSRRD